MYLVAKYKMNWKWHIKSAYGHGVAEMDIHQIKLKYPLLFFTAGCLILPILKIPYLLGKLIFKRDYYWQNVLIDLFGAAMHYKGRYDKYQEIKRQDERG